MVEDSVPENYYRIVVDRLRDGLRNQVPVCVRFQVGRLVGQSRWRGEEER